MRAGVMAVLLVDAKAARKVEMMVERTVAKLVVHLAVLMVEN